MEISQIEAFLFRNKPEHKEGYDDKYVDHYLEQYRLYLHIFNTTIERRQKSNEFFMGLNTALMAFLGYIEVKESATLAHGPILFLVIPLIGLSICYSWILLIKSYKNLNRAKFKVIHRIETKLPISNFETEWEILGRGKNPNKYRTISSIEKNIPLIFAILYIVIFVANIPQEFLNGLL